MLDLENFETVFKRISESSEFEELFCKIKESKHIFLLGNGGNSAVCQHAACDLQQYIKDKCFYSLPDVISLTAISSDFGYENALKVWTQNRLGVLNPSECFFIFVSSSGSADNLLNVVDVLDENKVDYRVISTKKHIDSPKILSLDVKYFHTGELLTLALFYEVASRFGANLKQVKPAN